MFMKRVLVAGGYEADWFEITEYVTSWGTIKESYGDNLYTGEYEIDGIQVEFNNSRAKFNDENDPNSLFFGFATRINTRFKLDVGFYDINQEEVPGRSFYGLSKSEPEVLGSGTIKYAIGSVMNVFKLFQAKGITEQNRPTDIHIERLVQKEQNAVRIFDRYFEGPDDATRYQIQAGAETFLIKILEEQTVWDKIKELSFYENFFPQITNDGNFEWVDRNETVAVQWIFNGAGSFDNVYGINIIDITQQLGVDRTYSRVTVRYGKGDTDIAVSEVNWTPGDGSIPDLYGVRVFEFEATAGELNNVRAQNVADRIRAATAAPHNIFVIDTTFIPHLRVNDRVLLNYRGSESGDAFILGTSQLGSQDRLGGARGAINLINRECKISAIEIDVNTLQCNFELTEL
jgi:hypothetical protein